jgi:Xaa-Pro aminopeptidase
MAAVTATPHYPVISLRVVQAISDVELERRRKRIRDLMAQKEIDVLVFHSLGGYLRYVTNYLGTGSVEYLLFPLQAELLFLGREDDSIMEARAHHGLADSRVLSPFESVERDAEIVSDAIKELEPKCVGIVDVSRAPAGFYTTLKERLQGVGLVDATSLVDEVRMTKSLNEKIAIERSARICDKAVDACKAVLRPGKREYEVIAEIVGEARRNASETEKIVTGSGPCSKEVLNLSLNLKNRMFSRGDLFRLHLYVSGPGGYWTEISRIFVLGKPTEDLKKAFEQAISVRQAALEKLRPGVKVGEVYEYALQKGKEIGCSLQKEVIGYSQGLDIVEKPILYKGVNEEIRPMMHFRLGCVVKVNKAYAQIADNYFVEEEEVRRLQKTPEEIFEIEV